MKKLVSIKGVIDNIRQSVNTPSPPGMPMGPVKLEQSILETLLPEQMKLEKTNRHGFPHKATCVAFDQVQRLLAIGTRSGAVRIFGRPGIDVEFSHPEGAAVMQVEFVVNAGKILTTCVDDSVNLWDYTRRPPELVQSVKINKERLTVMSLEFQDKWLYLGTERGNVLIMNLENFALSGYQIQWNKCLDPLMKNHPDAVNHISVNPADNGKLLIGFKSGLLCLWDLASKKGEMRYNYPYPLHSVSWHFEGRQFVATYGDGSLVTWNVKPSQPNKPTSVQFPHGKRNKETNKVCACDPIEKVLWRVSRSSGENYFIFSGGLPPDVTGVTPSITIMQGKASTLLEMENTVLDFLLVSDSAYSADYHEPEAIIVMLSNDLVAIDCKTSGYPCFKNPYAMDFNESPVTCCSYLVDCPGDLIPALYLVGNKVANAAGVGKGFSEGEWPVSGGVDSGSACSYTELVVTGHADGSVRFWDTSATSMQALHRLKTAKYFERNKNKNEPPPPTAAMEEDPYAIKQIYLCGDTRELAVAGGSGQVVFFRFKRKDTATETKSLEIPIVYEVSGQQQQNKGSSPSTQQQQHFEFPTPKPLLNVASQSSSYTDPVDGFNFDKPQYEYYCPLRVRAGAQRKSAGFHAELICLTPWVNGEPPTSISCLEINSNYGLMAYGNGSGLVIVDVVQFLCLLNIGTADLYGSMDPFQRMPRSPKPLDSSAAPDIVRVDLSSYSQVSASDPVTPSGETSCTSKQQQLQAKETLPQKDSMSGAMLSSSKAVDRVKSPDPRRLQKTGSSSAEEAGANNSNNFSKSQSSSANSLDAVVASEGVTAVQFCDSFTTKNDFTVAASLYVGTSLGSVITVAINLPDSGEPRFNEPVVVSPSGSIYRTRGAVLAFCFLDASVGCLLARGQAAENVKVPAKGGSGGGGPLAATPSIGSVSQSSQEDKSPPPSSAGVTSSSGDQLLVAVCTEKSASVFALPSQRQMYSQTISESSNAVVKAAVVNFGGGKYTPLLAAYTADGFIRTYSLPSLRPLFDSYLAARSPRLERTISFGDYGHGLYFSNANELQKFTLRADFARQLPTMQGAAYQDSLPMPEPPKQGFLKGLFFGGGAPKPLDREELFGETAGKVSSQMATQMVVPGNMTALQGKGVNTTSEVGKAKMSLVERGKKLSELEDRTEAMSNEAKQYAANAHNLMLTAKNKKWWQ